MDKLNPLKMRLDYFHLDTQIMTEHYSVPNSMALFGIKRPWPEYILSELISACKDDEVIIKCTHSHITKIKRDALSGANIPTCKKCNLTKRYFYFKGEWLDLYKHPFYCPGCGRLQHRPNSQTWLGVMEQIILLKEAGVVPLCNYCGFVLSGEIVGEYYGP